MVNDFETDTHRRVAGNLSQPRSARDLARFLARHDPYVEDAAHSEEGLDSYLKDLEADGLVKRIGSFEGGKALVAAVKDDDQTVTLPAEKAKTYIVRSANPEKFPYPDEEHWAMTYAGHRRLTGQAI
jgi:hypothetical protein